MHWKNLRRGNAAEAAPRAPAARLRRRWLGLGLAWASALACMPAHRLEPLAGGQVAEASGAGVRLQANAEAWSGTTTTADHSVPIWVEVSNRTDHPLRVRYSDWVLAGEGLRPAAPINIHRGFTLPSPTRGGQGYADRGWLAPVGYDSLTVRPSVDWFPGSWWRWRGNLYSPYWFPAGRSTTIYVAGGPYPSWDMIRLALGEGELEPGETRSGFLYFPRSVVRAHQLDLAWLVHDTDGQRVGTVGVPFRVQRGAAATDRSRGSAGDAVDRADPSLDGR